MKRDKPSVPPHNTEFSNRFTPFISNVGQRADNPDEEVMNLALPEKGENEEDEDLEAKCKEEKHKLIDF